MEGREDVIFQQSPDRAKGPGRGIVGVARGGMLERLEQEHY